MTPEGKAIELVDKFMVTIIFSINQNIEASVMGAAKNCALICVDNIIASNPHSNPFNTEVYSTIKYWKEVKEEINKI